MSRSERFGAGASRIMSLVIALLGVAILVRTLLAGGEATSFGIVIGVLFLALGSGRLYLGLRSSG